MEVWFDQDELIAGDAIVDKIQEGLRGSNYLLVLLSKHSTRSTWVKYEFASANQVFSSGAEGAIILVRLDETPIPEWLGGLRYVDFRKDYEEALKELVDVLAESSPPGKALDEVIDEKEFARAAAVHLRPRLGVEFYVSTVLAALAVVAAAFSAWPALETTFSQVPRVYWDLERATVSLPEGAVQAEVLEFLDSRGLAVETVQVRVINRGRAKAGQVRIGVNVDGEIRLLDTDPPKSADPVWVEIETERDDEGGKGRVLLDDLVPDRPVVIDVGYAPAKARIDCDVVADGVFAQKVDDIDLVPTWSLLNAAKEPLRILLGGLGLALLAGIITASVRSPRYGDKVIDLIEVVVPLLGRLLRVIAR